MSKFPVFLVLTISLFGCATSKPVSEQYESEEQKLYASILEELFRAKGVNMLCSQTAFTQCFGRTNERCLLELAPFSAQCVETSKDEVKIIKEKNTKQFSKAYVRCMASKSLVNHSPNFEETSSCIAQYKVDQEAMERALFN